MIKALFSDLLRALHELFSPRLLTPDECRLNVPAWKTKQVEAREVPRVGSNAKRIPGEANVYVWGDLSTVQDAGTLTPVEWGYVVDAYPSATPQLAGIVKRGISEGKTHAEIAHEAGQRLDKRVSVSVVSKIAAPLSRATGDGLSISGQNENEN
jgi:hypothetical protein